MHRAGIDSCFLSVESKLQTDIKRLQHENPQDDRAPCGLMNLEIRLLVCVNLVHRRHFAFAMTGSAGLTKKRGVGIGMGC